MPGLGKRRPSGSLSMDVLVREKIRTSFGFRFVTVPAYRTALQVESAIKSGHLKAGWPRLSPSSRPDRRRRMGVEMAKLIYASITSLDGYIADKEGRFDWAAPDDEVQAFINDLERAIGTHLYGRRMYETMVFWETGGTVVDPPSLNRDWAEIWRAAEKIVYSRTLQTVSSARTRIEREFDPDTVLQLKRASGADITVAGAELAGHAIGAGLVDECHLFLCPFLVGGGKRALPDNVHAQLELLDERRFRNGVVHLHYRVSVDRAANSSTSESI
jgi:dihydrofolate reductase